MGQVMASTLDLVSARRQQIVKIYDQFQLMTYPAIMTNCLMEPIQSAYLLDILLKGEDDYVSRAI